MANISHPSLSLLVKLGSIVVHADELTSPDGHEFDASAARSGIADPEVSEWIEAMSKAALLPRKRKPMTTINDAAVEAWKTAPEILADQILAVRDEYKKRRQDALDQMEWHASQGDAEETSDFSTEAERHSSALLACDRILKLVESFAAQPHMAPAETVDGGDLIKRLTDAANDPMWDAHAEVSKITLRRAVAEITRLRSAVAAARQEGIEAAARDVLVERERQKSVEGWTAEHDDGHRGGELAQAAAAYSLYTTDAYDSQPPAEVLFPSSWDAEWWKPSSDPRLNLVKAGALILAEIERLDRSRALSPVSDAQGKEGGGE